MALVLRWMPSVLDGGLRGDRMGRVKKLDIRDAVYVHTERRVWGPGFVTHPKTIVPAEFMKLNADHKVDVLTARKSWGKRIYHVSPPRKLTFHVPALDAEDFVLLTTIYIRPTWRQRFERSRVARLVGR
jgi:hypothetical protein